MTKLTRLPATIEFSAKCSDLFGATFQNEDGAAVAEYDGYVPAFFPGEHYGDYVQLQVNLKTGQILNWVPPTLAQINETLKDGGK